MGIRRLEIEIGDVGISMSQSWVLWFVLIQSKPGNDSFRSSDQHGVLSERTALKL